MLSGYAFCTRRVSAVVCDAALSPAENVGLCSIYDPKNGVVTFRTTLSAIVSSISEDSIYNSGSTTPVSICQTQHSFLLGQKDITLNHQMDQVAQMIPAFLELPYDAIYVPAVG